MLVPFFSQVGPARLPQTSSDSVLHAIVNVVIGQMLSGTAAGVIRTRVSTLTSKTEIGSAQSMIRNFRIAA